MKRYFRSAGAEEPSSFYERIENEDEGREDSACERRVHGGGVAFEQRVVEQNGEGGSVQQRAVDEEDGRGRSKGENERPHVGFKRISSREHPAEE